MKYYIKVENDIIVDKFGTTDKFNDRKDLILLQKDEYNDMPNIHHVSGECSFNYIDGVVKLRTDKEYLNAINSYVETVHDIALNI